MDNRLFRRLAVIRNLCRRPQVTRRRQGNRCIPCPRTSEYSIAFPAGLVARLRIGQKRESGHVGLSPGELVPHASQLVFERKFLTLGVAQRHCAGTAHGIVRLSAGRALGGRDSASNFAPCRASISLGQLTVTPGLTLGRPFERRPSIAASIRLSIWALRRSLD
jgi:hypothetical protein